MCPGVKAFWELLFWHLIKLWGQIWVILLPGNQASWRGENLSLWDGAEVVSWVYPLL